MTWLLVYLLLWMVFRLILSSRHRDYHYQPRHQPVYRARNLYLSAQQKPSDDNHGRR